jgi:ribosomal protein L11 methyltransferase
MRLDTDNHYQDKEKKTGSEVVWKVKCFQAEAGQALEDLPDSVDDPSYQGRSEDLAIRKALHSEVPTAEDLGVEIESVTFYFTSHQSAQAFADILEASYRVTLESDSHDSWLERYRSHFVGIDVEPFYSVRPSWIEEPAPYLRLILDPAMGFGTGTHPTTWLCLKEVGQFTQKSQGHLLDFGAGSGILAVGAALHGWKVSAVEIDPAALMAAQDLAALNGVASLIDCRVDIPPGQTYDLIVANILSHVLEDFASQLCQHLKPKGVLILSGLLGEEVDSIKNVYASCLGSHYLARVEQRDIWSALIFEPCLSEGL